MSLTILHRRRILESAVVEPIEATWSFDTLGTSSTNAFLVEREIDSVQKVFTYGELQDGSYETWLGGSNGGILEWYGDSGTMDNGYTDLIHLVPNAGDPYLYDWSDIANVGMIQATNMTQDWVISLIMSEEQNSNNQRLNVGIRHTGSNLFGLQLTGGGDGHIVIDRLTDSTGTPDYSFTFNNDANFKLMTFERVGGVFNIYINNVLVSKTTGSTFYTMTEQLTENSVVLGSRDYPEAGSGKITKYRHLGIVTGDLSAFDTSSHNQSIMTKYGIT